MNIIERQQNRARKRRRHERRIKRQLRRSKTIRGLDSRVME